MWLPQLLWQGRMLIQFGPLLERMSWCLFQTRSLLLAALTHSLHHGHTRRLYQQPADVTINNGDDHFEITLLIKYYVNQNTALKLYCLSRCPKVQFKLWFFVLCDFLALWIITIWLKGLTVYIFFIFFLLQISSCWKRAVICCYSWISDAQEGLIEHTQLQSVVNAF